MKLLKISKDGGPDSNVTGLFLVEVKWLFSIVLLRFSDGTRDVFHSHAFNSLSWVLRGRLNECRFVGVKEHPSGFLHKVFKASLLPIWTSRNNIHRVESVGSTYVFSLRGPWLNFWQEVDFKTNMITTLANGRRIVCQYIARS